ncbi:EamA family transporter [Aeromonas encheleia]|uniref:EamA family transporter n=1 Tax=Aeromonas encheleia TaxID=73010 RepID=UPI001F587F4A|nr:EamA family transporter [Aeromonas encheleia]UNP90162.1 EamA family transporter [Aeromonas encheleia]
MSLNWFSWALLSAIFAALTAIFAKLGVQHINSDLATLIRTAMILLVLGCYIGLSRQWSNPLQLSGHSWLFLGLSALATGASWLCYFRALQLGEASQVAPFDKFSLVLVVLFACLFLGERPALREWLGIGLIAVGVLVLAIRR